MNEIRVVNRYEIEKASNPRDVYIGRPSALGNPFPIDAKNNRAAVVNQFEKWLNGKIAADDELVCNELTRIAEMVTDESGKPVRLVCFCAPRACHGDIIKKVIEQAIEEQSQ